jgi:dynein heavy chain, axonemal
LTNVDLGSNEIKSAVCEACMDIHVSVTQAADDFYNELRRKYYTTPKSFLDLINLYCSLLAERRMEMGETKERLLVGLQKLQQTNSVVDKMKAELGMLVFSSCDMPHCALAIAFSCPTGASHRAVTRSARLP